MKMQASLNEINRLLITRYQEHEDMEADLDDEENRSSAWSTTFITQYGIFEWNRVAMGLKGSSPFFQRSMANKVYHMHM